jgi:hypothetical protein
VRASRIVRTDTITFNTMAAKKVISPSQILSNFDEAEIARQLTIIDGNSYSLIKVYVQLELYIYQLEISLQNY